MIRLSSLGDVVLTAPIYRSLKARWPDCEISVLVKPQFAAALEGNPLIFRIIPYRGFRAALAAVREAGFTHLLDLHANLRSFLIRRFSGVPRISVYRKNSLARRVFVAFGRSSPALQKHTVERYLEALGSWGVPPVHPAIGLEDRREGAPLRGLSPSNVLVIQSAFLGDSLLTLPLLRDIKSLFPAARLTVLTREDTVEIFRQGGWADEVMVDLKRAEHSGLFGTFRLSRLLKARRFDLAVIPHRSFRSGLLAWLAGVPRRLGFDSSAGRFFLTRAVAFPWPMHDLERNRTLLLPFQSSLGPRPEDCRYVSSEPETDALVSGRLRACGVDARERLVGVHPGSAWATKRWLPERYAELCRRLWAEGFRTVLVGGSQDAGLCVEIARKSGALDWSDKTDLKELKSLVARFSLFVTNDSGPMHVATALGVPTLAIFGPTTRELGFFPYGPAHRVIEVDLACRPCALHGGRSCPHGHFLCMKLITVDEVWRNAREMLKQPSLA